MSQRANEGCEYLATLAFNLAVRLGFPDAEPPAQHAAIIVHIGDGVTGLLVDAASGIINGAKDLV